MYAQKIIDRIGEDAWNRYKVVCKAFMARQIGVPVEKCDFNWEDAGKDGPIDPYNTPQCRWQQYDDKGNIQVTTEWRGFSYADVFEPTEAFRKDPELNKPQPGEQPAEVTKQPIEPTSAIDEQIKRENDADLLAE